jgi:hypothetical protein
MWLYLIVQLFKRRVNNSEPMVICNPISMEIFNQNIKIKGVFQDTSLMKTSPERPKIQRTTCRASADHLRTLNHILRTQYYSSSMFKGKE